MNKEINEELNQIAEAGRQIQILKASMAEKQEMIDAMNHARPHLGKLPAVIQAMDDAQARLESEILTEQKQLSDLTKNL